jgi:hypothetical protein
MQGPAAADFLHWGDGVHFPQGLVVFELVSGLDVVASPQVLKPLYARRYGVERQAAFGILHKAQAAQLGAIQDHGPHRDGGAWPQGAGGFERDAPATRGVGGVLGLGPVGRDPDRPARRRKAESNMKRKLEHGEQ